MANFDSCIEWVLRLEDRTLAGKTANLGDGAGQTRFGITSAVHPPTTFFTRTVSEALEMAKEIYQKEFWNPLHLGGLECDELAATILSFAVNDGVPEATKLLQRALGLFPDGVFGPVTLRTLLTHDGPLTARLLRQEQVLFYAQVEQNKPEDEKFLQGWDSRANAIYPNLPE